MRLYPNSERTGDGAGSLSAPPYGGKRATIIEKARLHFGVARALRHLCGKGLRYRALRDGEVIVWTEDRRGCVSPPTGSA